MRRIRDLAAALACCSLGGCISGAIYQHTTQPFDLNLRDTPAGTQEGTADMKLFDFSYVRIAWDGDDIGGAAKKAGLSEIFYADLETLNILGIWRQEWVHVYGR